MRLFSCLALVAVLAFAGFAEANPRGRSFSRGGCVAVNSGFHNFNRVQFVNRRSRSFIVVQSHFVNSFDADCVSAFDVGGCGGVRSRAFVRGCH